VRSHPELCSNTVTRCYALLRIVMRCYALLRAVQRSYALLRVVKRCYALLRVVTRCYALLRVVQFHSCEKRVRFLYTLISRRLHVSQQCVINQASM